MPGEPSVMPRACLVVVHPRIAEFVGTRFDLAESPARVGSAPGCEIRIDRASIAPLHALLTATDRAWILRDAPGVASTYKNDERVRAEAELACGDRVTIGAIVLSYVTGADLDELCLKELSPLLETDALTGTLTEHVLRETVQRQIVRARTWSRPLALLLIRVEAFEAIVEAHGEALSGFVLKAIASLVRGQITQGESAVGRLSEDGFAVVLPRATLAEARDLGGRIRRLVSSRPLKVVGERVRVAIAETVAVALEDGDANAAALLHRAASSGRRA